MATYTAATSPAILIFTVGSRPNPQLGPTLLEKGFRYWTCASLTDLRTILTLRRWSLVLIELPFPNGHGLRHCSRIRTLYAGPLAVISTDGTEEGQLRALETGADDFIDWPISPDLLRARLKALLRRRYTEQEPELLADPPIRVGNLTLDPARREVQRQDRRIELTDLEFDLLHLLARNTGTPVNRETLFKELRGLDYNGMDRSMDLRVSRLRRKLGDDNAAPTLILTVRGLGYQLAAGEF